MEKLNIDDLKILGEGAQIRKYIKKNYGNLEEFYYKSDVPIALTTFRTYLSRDTILSDTFKCAITKALGMDYTKVALSPIEQIKNNVMTIYDNIKKYNEEKDEEVINELLEMCKQEGLTYEIAMMYRAKAQNYYLRNKINHAEEYYGYALDTIPDFEGNLLVSFSSELADAYFRENMLSKSEKQYQLTAEYVERYRFKLTDKTLFLYYYWSGLLYLYTDRLDIARAYFENATTYAVSNRENASAIANVGLTYKKQNKYDEALKYYKDALNYQDESCLATIGVVYNNMSELYRCKGDYRNSQLCILEAFDMDEKNHNLVNHLIGYQTYVEIQIELGSCISFDKYFDILRSTKDKQINKFLIVQSIKAIIRSTNNKIYLKHLANVIYELIDASESSSFIQGLYECFGHIYVKIDILNGERVNEKAN